MKKSPALSPFCCLVVLIVALVLMLPLDALQAQESASDSGWSYSVGGRLWYAAWDREEDVSRITLGGNRPPPSDNVNPNPDNNRSNSESDPLPFYSVYADAIKGDWRFGIAAGFSGEYEFRNGRSDDDFERMDFQILAERRLNNYSAASLGLHYIDNEGSTEGQGRGIERQDFEYSFTGPEATLGAGYPIWQGTLRNDRLGLGDITIAGAASGTLGYYLVDDTTGFNSAMDDTPGYTFDLGLVALGERSSFKVGYRELYIDDSIWSINRITQNPDGEIDQEIVDTNETFKGFYVELNVDF